MKYIHEELSRKGARCVTTPQYDPQFSQYSFIVHEGTRRQYWLHCHTIGDVGNLRTATAVANGFAGCTPNLIFLVGIGGSLNPQTHKLGDVIVSFRVKTFYPDKVMACSADHVFDPNAPRGTNTFFIDPRKKLLSNSFLRYRRDYVAWEGSARFIAKYIESLKTNPVGIGGVTTIEMPRLKRKLENSTPQIRPGVIFSTEMVLDCKDYVQFIQEKNGDLNFDYYEQAKAKGRESRGKWFASDIDVVDMESYGFFKAIEARFGQHMGVQALSIRGVSDYSSEKTNLDTTTGRAVRARAAKNALNVALDAIDFASTEKIV